MFTTCYKVLLEISIALLVALSAASDFIEDRGVKPFGCTLHVVWDRIKKNVRVVLSWSRCVFLPRVWSVLYAADCCAVVQQH